MISAYAVVSAGFLLLGGRAADLLGRRRILVTGLALYAGASLAGALAPAPEALLAARVVQGLGGAFVGGMLTQGLGWEAVFLGEELEAVNAGGLSDAVLVVAAGIAATILVALPLRAAPRSPPPRRARADWPCTR